MRSAFHAIFLRESHERCIEIIAMALSAKHHGRKQIDAMGNIGNENERIRSRPFSQHTGQNNEPAVGASTWASGKPGMHRPHWI
ncbi:MAG: hypothetical protein CM15mP21_3070 [Hyphomicrobiales bacterium]|nr:MAG: hypothetical protein CM15mP21_3070 [Hyphomicrobiales bacterium]